MATNLPTIWAIIRTWSNLNCLFHPNTWDNQPQTTNQRTTMKTHSYIRTIHLSLSSLAYEKVILFYRRLSCLRYSLISLLYVCRTAYEALCVIVFGISVYFCDGWIPFCLLWVMTRHSTSWMQNDLQFFILINWCHQKELQDSYASLARYCGALSQMIEYTKNS